MATTIGPYRLDPKGAYSALTEYSLLDWVTDSGDSYVYIYATAATGVALTDTDHWYRFLDGVSTSGAVMQADFNAQTIMIAITDDTPTPLTVTEQTIIGRLTGGNIAAIPIGISDDNIVQMDDADAESGDYAKLTANGLQGRSAAEIRSDLNVEDGADVTDATNVDAAGAVMESDYNANTVLAATADDTPAALTIDEQKVLGRATGGNIAALAIDSDLSDVSTSDNTLPSAKATVAKIADNYNWQQSTDNPASVYPVPASALHVQASGTYSQAGSGDPSPSNIRALTPWVEEDDEIVVKRTGKNLCPIKTSKTQNGLTFTVNSDGSISVSGTATATTSFDFAGSYQSTTEIVPNSGGTTFTVSGGLSNAIMQCRYYDGSSTWTPGLDTFAVPEGQILTRILLFVSSGQTVSGTVYPQLEIGSSATDYEQYTNTDITLTATADIWSGYLNNDGEGEDEYNVLVLDGTETWVMHNSNATHILFYFENSALVDDAYPQQCSHFVESSNVISLGNENTFAIGATSHRLYIQVLITDYADVTAFKAYLAAQYAASTPVTVVYGRATALSLTPTAAPLAALAQVDRITPRNNVITLDTGNLTVDYAKSPIYNDAEIRALL